MTMEHDYFRKKVYMNTLSSTLIHHTPNLLPQWVSENQIHFLSAYEFASYHIEQQAITIFPRPQAENQVLTFQFKTQPNETNTDAYYIFQQQSDFYLAQLSQSKQQKILLYQNNQQNKQFMVYEFIDYLMTNDTEQSKSGKSIASRTQKLIEQIRQQELKENIQKNVQEMKSIKQLLIALDNQFAIALTEMKSKTGIMLVNISKCKKQKKEQFQCPIRPAYLNKITPELSLEEMEAPRIIYLLPEQVISLHKTLDLTQFVLLTEKSLLLIKVNYQQMELSVLHRIEFSRRQKITIAGVLSAGEDQLIVALADTPKQERPKAGLPNFLRIFLLQNKKFQEIKRQTKSIQCKEIESRIKFQDQLPEHQLSSVKFSQKILCSEYQIEEEEEEEQKGGDICGGVLMAVLNKMMNQDQNSQKSLINKTQIQFKQRIETLQTKKSITKLPSQIFKDALRRQNIAGLLCNQDLALIWEKKSPVIHVYQLLSRKQQEIRHKNQKEDDFSAQAMKNHKEKQIQEVYNQLMGIALEDTKVNNLQFQSKLTYLTRIDLGLIQQKIINLAISPNNSNIFIISGTDSRDHIEYNVFQLDLFRQLGHQDPSVFIKPIKNIHRPKPVQSITSSLVKESSLFLSGKVIHNLQSQILEGALSFDVHPYNFFLAVSFGFSTKVYAIETNEKLISLFTMNGQGMKQVKYSPLGNHLCILTSKVIKILDAYSFCPKFVLQEKVSNFLKCFFSSNGLQFYTVNQNHLFNVYNTFDFNKLQSIKPLQTITDFKPISIKSYLKISQYCLLLQNGSLYVRYKNNAVVVSEEVLFQYEDGEKINCIEIDEKNGVLFTGCKSGKLRAHIWPLKEQSAFSFYSEIRLSFSPITTLALSNISPLLYAGDQNGNVSKLKYAIDRDKGIDTEKDHNLLLTDRNFKYFSMHGASNVERMYRFVLANGVSLSTQEMPQKARLQFKLSQVIQKLNQQMKKMKINIREQLQQKSKLSLQKVDFGLLHHMNQMITTKLLKQLKEEVELDKKQINEMRQQCQKELDHIMSTQNQLIKEKSFKTYDYAQERNMLKEKLQKELKLQISHMEQIYKEHQQHNDYAHILSKEREEEIYFMPNDQLHQYEEEKQALIQELQAQSKRHYSLNKACAYKETAIRQMHSKKMKEETLEFKIGLQKDQMSKKLNYNQTVVDNLKQKIQQSEQKVYQIQTQAFIIKSNAQYKREARLEEMIDACSYKLWMKNKLEEEQIADLANYLKAIEDIMESKGGEIIELLDQEKTHAEKITEANQYITERKQKLAEIKLHLLTCRHQLKQVDVMTMYKSGLKNLHSTNARHDIPRLSCKAGEIQQTERQLKRAQSSRAMVKIREYQPIYYKLMDKQTNFLKANIKIHQRKMKKMNKQNGKLLFQFEKLNLQTKYLEEKQLSTINSLERIKHQNKLAAKTKEEEGKTDLQLGKTSFQKYLQLKTARNKNTPKYQTASSTPRHLTTPYVVDQNELKISKVAEVK